VFIYFYPQSRHWRVDCERTTDSRSRISCLNLTSLYALFVFLLWKLTSGALTIDSLTPTLRINLNEHQILLRIRKRIPYFRPQNEGEIDNFVQNFKFLIKFLIIIILPLYLLCCCFVFFIA
jgi:hypothetical protein